MKKKLFLIVCMCLFLLGITACGETDPTTVDYNGYSYDQLQQMAQGTITTLVGLSDQEKASYMMSGDEMTMNLITRWEDSCNGIGAYQGFGEFTVTKSGKTLTVDQEVLFEERPVIVSYVYNYNSMELTDVNINIVQTLGEKMSNASMNTVMGIGTVFVMLILISLIIYAFRVISYLEKKKKAAEEQPAVAASPVVEQIAAREQQDDLELAAVIAAAIAAATGASTDDFVVRSIKRR